MVLNALHIRRPPPKFALASICANDRACSSAREKYRDFLGRAFNNNDEFAYYLEANPTLFKTKEWKENGVTFIEIGDNIDPLWSEITILTSGLTGLYDQENIFDARTEAVKPRGAVIQSGVTLDELGKILVAHDLQVTVHHAGESSLEEFRKLAVSELIGNDRFVLVNYLRSSIGQTPWDIFRLSPLTTETATGSLFSMYRATNTRQSEWKLSPSLQP